jgi:hypothetical protein
MARKWRKWGIALCAVLAALLVGCQAVAGLNYDDVVLKQLDVKSAEQSGSVSVDLDWNPKFLSTLDPQEARLLELLAHASLKIEQAKVDEHHRGSYAASIELNGKKPVKFALQMDGERMLIQAEGARKPLFLDLGDADVPAAAGGLEEPVRKLAKEVIRYFVHHLPNPDKVSVSREWSSVNGQSTPLTKLHAELDGEELGGLLARYVDALVGDEAGMRKLLESVAGQLSALPPDLLGGIFGEEAPSDEEIHSWIDEGMQTILPGLKQAQAKIAELKDSLEWSLVFDRGTQLKADYYVDDSLNLRKSDLDLVIAPAVFKLSQFPVRSISVRSHSEIWNINGDVSIPAIEKPADALGTDDLDGMSAIGLLRNFEENSPIYDLLKNEFQVDDITFDLDVYSMYGTPPLLDQDAGGRAIVELPLRQTLDGFEDRIEYDHAARQIRFTDEGTDQEIVLTVGSADATVNGAPVQLSVPVHLHDSNAYIGADDLLKLLRATYTYVEEEDGTLTVTVSRDL